MKGFVSIAVIVRFYPRVHRTDLRYLFGVFSCSVLSLLVKVGVALLGGFGDLNVDRSGGSKGDDADKDKGKNSTALVIPPSELLKMRPPELKKKLREAGVDLAKYPWAVEKKVRTCVTVVEAPVIG